MILAPRDRIADYTARGWWGTKRIHDWFDEAVRTRPAAEALVDAPNRAEFIAGAPRRLTWQQLDAEVHRFAAHFLALGLASDDIVCIQLPNCVELPAVYLACAKLGLIATPVPVQYREHELAHILALVEPRAVVTAGRILRHRHADMMRGLAREHGSIRSVLAIDEDATQTVPAAVLEEHERSHRVDANAIFTICWTSGTEGVPKGVPRSHNEWMAIPENIILSGGLAPGCHLLNAFPLVNMAGIAGQFLPWLMTGAKLVMHHPFSLPVFLDQVRDEAIDYTVAAPAILATLAQNPDLMRGIPGSRLRAIGSGGAPLAQWTVQVFTERYGIDVINYFGTNEGASLTASALDLPDPALRATYFPRFGVAGLEWKLPVAKRVSTRLVDPDSGEDIDTPGRPGELRVKGPAVFAGYYRSPEMTARAFDASGYYRTGDLFEIAGERNDLYRFVGRLKDIIVRGGFNISSEELEALLLAHPAVREAAIVGYPDDTLGERVCAVVALQPGSALDLSTLVAFLRNEKKMASYKLPEKLLVVDALPRNPVGKLLKRELRAAVAAAS
ncbi:MAG: class I adenylate-forming enzyme family protein [Betaproteobacteria bacterium]